MVSKSLFGDTRIAERTLLQIKEEYAEQNRGSDVTIGMEGFRKIAMRRRKSNMPTEPSGPICSADIDIEKICPYFDLAALIRSNKRKHLVLFSTPQADLLTHAEDVFIDATFKIVARHCKWV